MSQRRTKRRALSRDIRDFDNTDWRNSPSEFIQLCDFILEMLSKRDGITPRKLFNVLSETGFREQIRACAEGFRPSSRCLAAYIYLKMKLLVLPGIFAGKKARD